MKALRSAMAGTSPSGTSSECRRLRWIRLCATAPRRLATVVLLVLLLFGLRGLLWAPAPSAPPRLPQHADAPSEDFALQFARAYLTYDPARPALRSRLLAAFLPEGGATEGSFLDASGAQRVRWAEIASDQPSLLGGRVITVAAGVSTQRAPLYLAVSVRHRPNGPLSLLGYPAFVGAPRAQALQSPVGEEVTDRAVAEVAKRVIGNYLARSVQNLRADLAPDADVALPTVGLSLQKVEALEWIGAPGSGAVLVTLTTLDARGAAYRLAYEIGIEERERPYVDFIEVLPTAG
jgi:hypothetical protein